MIEYRKATVGEGDLLAKIRVDFLLEAKNIDDTEEEKTLMFERNRRFMARALADGSFVSWVAVQDGEIIATSGVSFYTLPPNKEYPDGKVAYISNMFTCPEYRNQGVASKLFALALEEAQSRGCAKISLTASDMGRPIYEKYGFMTVDKEMFFHIE